MNQNHHSELEKQLSSLQGRLTAFVRKKISHADHVEDIVQDVLSLAFQKRGTLTDESRLESWVLGIAQNKCREYYRAREQDSLKKLHDRLTDSKEKSNHDKALWRQFDELCSLPLLANRRFDTAMTLLLKAGLNWSNDEIASALGISPKTVYTRLNRSRHSRAKAKPLTEKEIITLKVEFAGLIGKCACRTVEGFGFRNLNLLAEAYYFSKLLLLQYPKEPEVKVMHVIICFVRAWQSQYTTDNEPPLPVDLWQRERWDKKLKSEALLLYKKLKSETMPKRPKLWLDYAVFMFGPNRNEHVNWQEIFRVCEEYIRLGPYSDQLEYVYNAATSLEHMAGPLSAAAYLEKFKGGNILRNNFMTFQFLGNCYFKAEKFKEAAKNYRKALVFSMSESRRNKIQSLLAACGKKNNEA